MTSSIPEDMSKSSAATSLSYADAGVDIDAGNQLVQRIKHVTEKTRRPEVLSSIGGFGGLVELPQGYKNPVLVPATDGVGTKLKLATLLGKHDTIGIDLVAMCVNDLIVCGAEPLFFLDYYASGKLDVDLATAVVEGIGTGCELSECSLVGGETAEMPGMYDGSDYDLAGFAVGIVDKNAIIDASKVKAGDKLIGLTSSGPHSNGYSLIRKIIEKSNADLSASFEQSTLGDALLEPTEIYVKAIKAVSESVDLHAIAHITGGGILENVPRVLPANCAAVINENSWQIPEIFSWLQRHGNIEQEEMYRTFNCGLGMILCVAPDEADTALSILQKHNKGAVEIGVIEQCGENSEQVIFTNQE